MNRFLPIIYSPNILALNVFPLLTQKIIFLVLVMLIALVLVYYFHRATRRLITPTSNTEGILSSGSKDSGSGWGVVLASFILIVLYLPISTIAVHGLVSAFLFCLLLILNYIDG